MTDSGSSPPTATTSLASAIVTRAAVAINGLKLRAVRRYHRLPSVSARAANTSATSARIEHSRTCGTPSMTRSSLPSASSVPAPTGVKKPEIPAPPARIASANVPCGSSVASISPALTAATASGFEVKYDEIPRRIRPCRSSMPSPFPGSPMLFEMSDVRLNPDLPPDAFDLKVPDGTRVLTHKVGK